jgi:SAM-dependent MidA family methyltransferase
LVFVINILPGLQDITAHVDFTAVGEAALAAGIGVAGYTSQAVFLVNSGLLDLTQGLRSGAGAAQARVTVNRDITLMTSPAEMGELFKVIALTRGIDGSLLGFVRGDRRVMLG